jgi:hypothetical protein
MKKEACVLVFVTALTAAACTGTNTTTTSCRNIPANGCPVVTDDRECEDPSCAAAYSCNNGAWTLDHTCSAFDGGHAEAPPFVPDAGLPDAGSGEGGEGDCPDAQGFDAPPGAGGGPGCGPLDPPDCPLSRALSCDPASATACNECDSFFACVDGAWIFWGGCSSEGGVTLKN